MVEIVDKRGQDKYAGLVEKEQDTHLHLSEAERNQNEAKQKRMKVVGIYYDPETHQISVVPLQNVGKGLEAVSLLREALYQVETTNTLSKFLQLVGPKLSRMMIAALDEKVNGRAPV